MTDLAKTIRVYLVILIVTLVGVEALSFGVVTFRAAAGGDLGFVRAIAVTVRRHPLFDRSGERDSELLFLPTTQVAFRANTTFSDLLVGQHGFILNSEREPADFPAKPEGVTRIALLGGSSAAGVTATSNDRTIAAQLERLLNEESGDEQVFQVLNFGVGGNYSYGEVSKLITEVAYLDPDVVIMFDGFNDAHYSNLEHLRAGLEAPLMNWGDFSYHYFDGMAGLGGVARPAPFLMTYSYLLVQSIVGEGRGGAVRGQRAEIYRELPVSRLSSWVAAGDPHFDTVLKTNLDFAAAWSARNGVAFVAYLQPHPWEYKDLSCERAEQTNMMIGRLGPTIDEAKYIEIMQSAFEGYAEAYVELDASYSDASRVRFIDMRRLFSSTSECIYNDPIHYNDDGNLAIAVRMRDDLSNSGMLD